MRRRHVPLPGLRSAPDVRGAVHGGDPGAHYLDGYCRYSRRFAGRYRRDSERGGPAVGGSWSAVGSGSHPGHGSQLSHSFCGCGVLGHCRSSRGRERRPERRLTHRSMSRGNRHANSPRQRATRMLHAFPPRDVLSQHARNCSFSAEITSRRVGSLALRCPSRMSIGLRGHRPCNSMKLTFYCHSYFSWRTDKALSNMRKHGIAFEDVLEVFADPLASNRPDSDFADEERWIVLGMMKDKTLVAVVHTYEERDDYDQVRIISA